MNTVQKRLLCNWLVDIKSVKQEQEYLNNILSDNKLKVSVSPENTGSRSTPEHISEIKFIGVHTTFPKKGNSAVIKELTSRGYEIWEHTIDSKKSITANKVLNIQDEFQDFYEELIQCSICNNIYLESMVNIVDQEDDVCIHCEKKLAL